MKENNTMKEMVEEERPYEKCIRFGASNLTDIELLAVLLRTGTRGENSLGLADKLLHPAFYACQNSPRGWLRQTHSQVLIFRRRLP